MTTPIGDYGLIGDTRTAALVGPDGAIDWMCVPRFDGENVFGRLVGGPDAGTFIVAPSDARARLVERRYREDTATLETTWAAGSARVSLADTMVAELEGLLPTTTLVRTVRAVGGAATVRVMFDPRLGPGFAGPRTRRHGDGIVATWSSLALSLVSSDGTLVEPGRPVEIEVADGRSLVLALGVAFREPAVLVGGAAATAAAARDEADWRAWCSEIHVDMPRRATVTRSLVTLQLLTYSPSGAPVAAPTTSLPEELGGVRNWDYRYAWPRDASIGVGALLGAGKEHDAEQFLSWLLHASRIERPRLPVLLTLDGRTPPPERELGWVGYRGSRPVRTGNAASRQHQLDGYGWVVDAAWMLDASGHRIYNETWRAVRGFADRVAATWRKADAGIWEVRADPAHHVHSKFMGWAAIDRALRLADNGHRLSDRRRKQWERARHDIAKDVAARGFDSERNTYTRAYGDPALDAAVLLLPVAGMEPGDSPRVSGTIDAIRRELSAGPGLLYRYPPGSDGLAGGEGAFVACAFWLTQALAAARRLDEADEAFDAAVGHGTALGLFAEEVDPSSGAHLGNFPQALSHSTLVRAALSLRDAQRLATRQP